MGVGCRDRQGKRRRSFFRADRGAGVLHGGQLRPLSPPDGGLIRDHTAPARRCGEPTGYAAYDALLAEIADLRRSGTSDVQTDFSHDLLSVNDYYQTPGWLLRDLDGDGTPELLLGADWGDGHSVIFNIYRLDGAKAAGAGSAGTAVSIFLL